MDVPFLLSSILLDENWENWWKMYRTDEDFIYSFIYSKVIKRNI